MTYGIFEIIPSNTKKEFLSFSFSTTENPKTILINFYPNTIDISYVKSFPSFSVYYYI